MRSAIEETRSSGLANVVSIENQIHSMAGPPAPVPLKIDMPGRGGEQADSGVNLGGQQLELLDAFRYGLLACYVPGAISGFRSAVPRRVRAVCESARFCAVARGNLRADRLSSQAKDHSTIDVTDTFHAKRTGRSAIRGCMSLSIPAGTERA
jgi:hypothetical protein